MGRMTRAMTTNCMIALRSPSPIRPTSRCRGSRRWRSTATVPPSATATGMAPTTTQAPMPYMRTAASSVVCPGSASPFRSRTRLPDTTNAATTSSPAATTQPPNTRPSCAARAPNSVMSANVRIPAIAESARSRCSPTSRPRPSATASWRKGVGIMEGLRRGFYPRPRPRYRREPPRRLLEDLCQRDLEAREERSGQDVSSLGGKLGGESQAASLPAEDPDRLLVGIEHPILPDAEEVVALELDPFVPPAGAPGEDLYDQVGSTLDVLLGEDPQPLVGDIEKVRYDDVVGRENDVTGSSVDLSEAVLPDEGVQEGVKVGKDILVRHEGRCGHVMLSVQDLVTQAVLRKEDIILVGQLGEIVGKSHTAPPCATSSYHARPVLTRYPRKASPGFSRDGTYHRRTAPWPEHEWGSWRGSGRDSIRRPSGMDVGRCRLDLPTGAGPVATLVISIRPASMLLYAPNGDGTKRRHQPPA